MTLPENGYPEEKPETLDDEEKIIQELTEASVLVERCIVTTTLNGPRERIGRLYHLTLALHSMQQALME